MCGLFGFIGNSLNTQILKKIAQEASRRGPHAFGFAWYYDRINVYKKVGNLEDYLHLLDQVQGKWIVGNARLATSGDWKNLSNNQPLVHEDLCVVYNGNVYNHQQLFEQYAYKPRTENDAEAVLAIANGVTKEQQGQRILKEIDSRSPMAMILACQQDLLVVRRWHPLYIHEEDDNVYLCSRALDKSWKMLVELEPVTFVL